MRTPTIRTLLLPALLALAGCAPADEFGGLDSNRDGLLRPADLEPGTAGVYLWRTGADGETNEEAHLSTDARVIFDLTLSRWVLQVSLEGVPEYVLHVAFDPDSGLSGPAVGVTDVLAVSVDVPAREHGGDGVPEGTFTVDESAADIAFGWVDLDVPVMMRSNVQGVETGEQVRFAGIAFSELEVSQ